MVKKKDYYNLIYILVFVMIASIGLNNSLGISKGEFNPPIFYTSFSGLICFIYFFIALVNGIIVLIKKKDFPDSLFLVPRAKGAVTICITVTLLVYHFLVYEGSMLTIDTDIYNLITHYIVPIMVIAHWIIFDKKGTYKKIDPLLWTIIPIGYFSWANVVAAMNTVTPYWDGEFYPYSFMDLTIHPLSKVVITIVLLLLFFIALGYGVYAIDSKADNK